MPPNQVARQLEPAKHSNTREKTFKWGWYYGSWMGNQGRQRQPKFNTQSQNPAERPKFSKRGEASILGPTLDRIGQDGVGQVSTEMQGTRQVGTERRVQPADRMGVWLRSGHTISEGALSLAVSAH